MHLPMHHNHPCFRVISQMHMPLVLYLPICLLDVRHANTQLAVALRSRCLHELAWQPNQCWHAVRTTMPFNAYRRRSQRNNDCIQELVQTSSSRNTPLQRQHCNSLPAAVRCTCHFSLTDLLTAHGQNNTNTTLRRT